MNSESEIWYCYGCDYEIVVKSSFFIIDIYITGLSKIICARCISQIMLFNATMAIVNKFKSL